MLKGIIFDADGTLLNSMKIWMELPSKFLKIYGKKTSKKIEQKIFSMTLEQGCSFLKTVYKLPQSQEEIQNELFSILEKSYKNEISLKKGVYNFLLFLKQNNIPMAIATSGNKSLLEYALLQNNYQHFFCKILTCDELNTDKANPKIFTYLARYFNAKPDEILIFEDSFLPIKTAKNAGFNVVAIKDRYSYKDKSEIKNISDLYLCNFSSKKLRNFIKKI